MNISHISIFTFKFCQLPINHKINGRLIHLNGDNRMRAIPGIYKNQQCNSCNVLITFWMNISDYVNARRYIIQSGVTIVAVFIVLYHAWIKYNSLKVNKERNNSSNTTNSKKMLGTTLVLRVVTNIYYLQSPDIYFLVFKGTITLIIMNKIK